MRFNRDQVLEEGYLIVRPCVPPDRLEDLRRSYEILVERQKVRWAQERKPDDPPGGVWDTSPQPRLVVHRTPEFIDDQTAPAVEFWLHENTLGVSTELLGLDDPGVTEMMLMCSPVRDHGPANWHRDLHPIDTAPLSGYIDDLLENGPRYVQWNIPLYDDSVLWVVPGSHRRWNTPEENRQLLENPRVPLPGSIPVELNAGDGVVYILPILHWGSNYSTRMRRTIHGGYSTHTQYPDLCYTRYLKPASRALFERWDRRSRRMQDLTESALRAVIARDRHAYTNALEQIQPGGGPKGQALTTVFLLKAACHIYGHTHPESAEIPEQLRRHGMGSHAGTLNWGPAFSRRFSVDEADILWKRFKPLDGLLQAPEPHFSPGFQSGPMRYYFNEMPPGFGLETFFASWGD
jgi:hypothetical protein